MKRGLIHQELSYTITGVLFAVHNELGRYRGEKQYGDMLEKYFRERDIPYAREVVLPVNFSGEKAGRNRVDFLLDGKIVLEIKAKRFLEKADYYQMMRYLESCKKRLGILVNFHQRHLVPKRIVRGYADDL